MLFSNTNRPPRKRVGGVAFVLPLCSSILIKINYIKCSAQTDTLNSSNKNKVSELK